MVVFLVPCFQPDNQSTSVWYLGMHNIIERPVAVDSKVAIRPMMISPSTIIVLLMEEVGRVFGSCKEALEDPLNILMDGDPKRP